jgi:hypothetical protein
MPPRKRPPTTMHEIAIAIEKLNDADLQLSHIDLTKTTELQRERLLEAGRRLDLLRGDLDLLRQILIEAFLADPPTLPPSLHSSPADQYS